VPELPEERGRFNDAQTGVASDETPIVLPQYVKPVFTMISMWSQGAA
jgi:hypothetical protein